MAEAEGSTGRNDWLGSCKKKVVSTWTTSSCIEAGNLLAPLMDPSHQAAGVGPLSPPKVVCIPPLIMIFIHDEEKGQNYWESFGRDQAESMRIWI